MTPSQSAVSAKPYRSLLCQQEWESLGIPVLEDVSHISGLSVRKIDFNGTPLPLSLHYDGKLLSPLKFSLRKSIEELIDCGLDINNASRLAVLRELL